MKKYAYPGLMVLIALFLAAAGVALAFLPDIVPAHYNSAGEVDRMGSKFEYLIFPVSGAVMGAIFALVARQWGKKGDKESALVEMSLLGTAFFEVLLIGGLGLYFMWRAATYAPGDTGPVVGEDIPRVAGMAVGVLLILLGNVMPKARRNSFFGLRTKWSMASDEVWRKSQRFGGFSGVAVGFALIVAGIFLDAFAHLMVCTAAVALWAGVSTWMSYRIYQKTV